MRLLKIYVILLCCAAGFDMQAQEAVALSHYVFNAFSSGKVLQKSGQVDEAKLNYNTLSSEMIFESRPGLYLALANPEKVDTVFILDRKFVYINDKFYELLSTTAYPLFAEYSCTVKEPGSDIGYGMSSVTTASPAVKSLIQGGGAYSLKLPDGFQVATTSTYWIFVEGKYKKAGTAKQIMAALPAKKEQIAEWIKKNNTSFNNKQDIINLLQQL